mmetsp:Transcript_83250/g.199804  ORF Transcript_83250/g.199804 Transcript_83250/m.199804 type:complete len:220 (-) Transcript_83250:289-948(-)
MRPQTLHHKPLILAFHGDVLDVNAPHAEERRCLGHFDLEQGQDKGDSEKDGHHSQARCSQTVDLALLAVGARHVPREVAHHALALEVHEVTDALDDDLANLLEVFLVRATALISRSAPADCLLPRHGVLCSIHSEDVPGVCVHSTAALAVGEFREPQDVLAGQLRALEAHLQGGVHVKGLFRQPVRAIHLEPTCNHNELEDVRAVPSCVRVLLAPAQLV